MNEMVKGIILAGGTGLVLFAVIFFGLGSLISDEKGLPVPTTVAGNTCWLTTKGIDVLDCRKSEQGQDFFVRWKGHWWSVSRCHTQEAARLLRFRSPYPLRIDLRGIYPKVTAA